jgi:NAD(P)H-nitrite reductase large subunit
MVVMYSDILKAIEAGSYTYEALQDALGVGTGCSSCVPEVKSILRETKG